MTSRAVLTNIAWTRIAPLLPRNGRRSGQWRGHRLVINGILGKEFAS